MILVIARDVFFRRRVNFVNFFVLNDSAEVVINGLKFGGVAVRRRRNRQISFQFDALVVLIILIFERAFPVAGANVMI